MVINMDKDTEFLNYIYQNARMGVIGIKSIQDKIPDRDLNFIISEQLEDYEVICQKALKLFEKMNKTEKDVNLMAKISTYLMSNYYLNNEKSTNKIAKMMIEGSNKGIIEITEKLNSYDSANSEIINLAEKLLNIEQKNLDKLKPFL